MPARYLARQRGRPAESGPVRDPRESRAAFLGKGVAAAGAVAGGAIVLGRGAGPARSSPSAAQDVRILNFLLLLEYLQADFYAQATKAGRLSGELADFARIVAGHEQAHVTFLRQTLGARARKKPRLEFGDAVRDRQRFTSVAASLEETGVQAYNGQGASLTAGALASITKIVSVEARHAAWIRDILGEIPAPRAADPSETAVQVDAALKKTGFIRGG